MKTALPFFVALLTFASQAQAGLGLDFTADARAQCVQKAKAQCGASVRGFERPMRAWGYGSLLNMRLTNGTYAVCQYEVNVDWMDKTNSAPTEVSLEVLCNNRFEFFW